ncbi:hypothetical protein BH23GEM9_BH23GEM9_30400 [soil metagenome]
MQGEMPGVDGSGADDARRVALEDEILELLYWLEGEGFAGSSSLPAMTRFLDRPTDAVTAALAHLARVGSIAPDGTEYRLTATGRREAGRRFAETFAPLLGQGHGECNDPDCDCHNDPAGGAACHARSHAATHEES